MAVITASTRLERVEHVLTAGTGVLDFAVADRNEYVTWRGAEDADWVFEDVGSVENVDEDRMIVYPEGDYFVCEIPADGENANEGAVTCWSE